MRKGSRPTFESKEESERDFVASQNREGETNKQPVILTESQMIEHDLEIQFNNLPKYLQRESLRAKSQEKDQIQLERLRDSMGIKKPETGQELEEKDHHPAISPEEEKKLASAAEAILELPKDAGTEEIEKASIDFARQICDFLFQPGVKSRLSPEAVKALEAAQQLRPLIEKAANKGYESLQSTDLAQKLVPVLDKMNAELPNGYWGDLRKRLEEQLNKNAPAGKLKRMVSLGVDFVPVAGPAKMLLETIKGKTMHGTELKGWNRVWQGLEGGCFLILDCTGVGAIATKSVKGSTVAAKLFSRSAAVARKIGMGREIYQPIYKTGKLISKNPILSRVADKSFSHVLAQRRARKIEMLT